MKGIALGLYPADSDKTYDRMVGEIAGEGAGYVSLVVMWRQHDIHANDIAPSDNTIADDRLRAVIKDAHAHNLKVFLFPILEIEVRRALEWRGTLQPKDVNAWWASYENFIMHYAQLGADEKVELFAVGSELVSTEVWQDRWTHLIRQVRKTLPNGQLLYSANWDHFEQVTFWDLVDYVGVTAYNELTKSNDASEDELARAWADTRATLVQFSQKVKKPLVITEIGYTSQDGAAVHPWDYTLHAKIDLEEQRRCYAAFVDAWSGEDALAGVYWWNWYGDGGDKDASYTPKGKPAEKVLHDWYAKP
jgi:hypothetical protein